MDQLIRDQVPYAEIARRFAEYNLSPDAIERHGRNHVLKATKANSVSPSALLRELIEELGELSQDAKRKNDVRGSIDATAKRLQAALSLLEHEAREKDEAHSPEPVWIRGELNPRADLRSMTIEDWDACVGSVEAIRERLLRDGGCCPTCTTEFPKPVEVSKVQ